MIDDDIGVMRPKIDDINMFHKCSTNKERNFVVTTMFSKYVDEKYQLAKQCDHTIILKSWIGCKQGLRSESFHDYVINHYRDNNISI